MKTNTAPLPILTLTILLVLAALLLAVLPSRGSGLVNHIGSLAAGPAGATNRILAASSNVLTAAQSEIDCTDARSVALSLTFNMVTAGATSNVWFYLHTSVDGITIKSNVHVLGATASGTSTVSAQTNLDVGGYKFLYVSPVINTNTVAATNVSLVSNSKRGL